MASRQSLVAIVALSLVLAACTTGADPVDPTAPPDVFSPTPSIGEIAPTTTTTARPTSPTRPPRVGVDRIEIFPVDPRTLEALPGFAPMPMGDWTSGVSSPNGRWLALYYGDDTGFNAGARLVDVPAWEMAAEWTEDLRPISVDDEGTVLAMDRRGPSPALARLVVGQERSEPVAELPAYFNMWAWPVTLDEGRVLLMGPIFDGTGAPGHIEIVIVDQTTGLITETPLPNVPFGAAEIIDLGDGRAGVVDVMPAVVWDDSNDRALIVHAAADLVTEVIPESGEISEHRFGPRTAAFREPPLDAGSSNLWASTRRTAAISPDGRVMYVAGQVGDIAEREGGPISVATPTGLIVLDTVAWEITDRLDEPVSDLFLSADGSRLIAAGYHHENDGLNSYETQSFGLYLIDPLGLDVISHRPPKPSDEGYGPVSYSADGKLAYVTTWAGLREVVVIDLETGDSIANRAGERVQVFGEVGVMADSADQGG